MLRAAYTVSSSSFLPLPFNNVDNYNNNDNIYENNDDNNRKIDNNRNNKNNDNDMKDNNDVNDINNDYSFYFNCVQIDQNLFPSWFCMFAVTRKDFPEYGTNNILIQTF